MTKISLIRPTDQPQGRRRLLEDLKAGLNDPRFTDFRLIVAYAKARPLDHLRRDLLKWRQSGRKCSAILGIDQQGTSREALERALEFFDHVYVTQHRGLTFHPKLYVFTGANAASVFVGSNNLTTGGTETNFESTLHLEFELPANSADLDLFESSWRELLPEVCGATFQLDSAELGRLVADRSVLDEDAMRAAVGGRDWSESGRPASRFPVKPASPLPRLRQAGAGRTAPPEKPAAPSEARGHAIQIRPHHNGEIFLSKTAVKQNPAFFDFPFTGRTTPKIPSNPSYPQLEPDPLVDISVVGSDGKTILEIGGYSLNTVYYESKEEIRVTASPLVGVVPEYSVMVMAESERDGIRYDLLIHTPDSPEYESWLAVCDQSMPGGGKPPRRFGWF